MSRKDFLGVADIREGSGMPGSALPLFWVEKTQKEENPGRVSIPSPSPFVQGLDLPLFSDSFKPL